MSTPTLYTEGLGRHAILVDGGRRASEYGNAARFKIRSAADRSLPTRYLVAPTDDAFGRAPQDLAEAAFRADQGLDAASALVTITLSD